MTIDGFINFAPQYHFAVSLDNILQPHLADFQQGGNHRFNIAIN